MKTWKEIETEAFITGRKLPKEIVETNENHKFLKNTVRLLCEAETSISKFKNNIFSLVNEYESAKDNMNKDLLIKLNKDSLVIKKIIDDNFDTTLNGLISKPKEKTEEEVVEYLGKIFKF